MVAAHSQHAARHRHRHMVAASVVWCGERVSRTRMHRSMAVCLVSYNTGIAQSSPDPFLCDTRWSQFSALFMHGRRRKKKCEKPKHTAAHFGGSWCPRDYPLKFEEKHLRTTGLANFLLSVISHVALGCLIINEEGGVRCCRYSDSDIKKCGYLHRSLYVNDTLHTHTPHSTEREKKSSKKRGESESSTDMFR